MKIRETQLLIVYVGGHFPRPTNTNAVPSSFSKITAYMFLDKLIKVRDLYLFDTTQSMRLLWAAFLDRCLLGEFTQTSDSLGAKALRKREEPLEIAVELLL
jgi:hypothetical protein